MCFYFQDERKARDAYDSIKAWTCKIRSIEKLYAFSYTPVGPEKEVSQNAGGGWSVYDPMREWRRQGVDKNSNWRVTKINKDYSFCETYPATMAVPSSISDNTLNYAVRYRSKQRIPALSYLHPINNCTITRCAQPMVGFQNKRSIQDEKLLAAIFNTTHNSRPLSGFISTPPPEREDSEVVVSSIPALESETSNQEALENAYMSKARSEGPEKDEELDDKGPKIYGAQQRNMIIDARPTINAMAMQAIGAGSENMDNYPFASKAYLGIDNIHVMRDSLNKVVETLKDSDLTPLGPNREALHNSKWLKHIANMMDGVGLIARQISLQHSHVLIHCSDGWDRTSQLSALSQICLDPYYRTMEGFIVLVEKDWVSFGHRFRYRGGPLSSEKWFQIENERVSARNDDPDREEDRGRAAEALQGAQKSLGNAFLSAKGWFKQGNDSRESLNVDSEAEANATGDIDAAKRVVSTGGKNDKSVTKVNEVSPIFHQFLDATYQLLYQYPTRFEFTERFLRRLLYHVYSCQYGTFLFDNEKDRKEAKIHTRTRSVWDYFLARKKEFLNPKYDPLIDDNVRGKERLIFPRTDEIRWWNEVFGRTDDEMNSRLKSFTNKVNGTSDVDSEMSSYGMQSQVSASVPVSRARTPVLTGIETADTAIGVAAGSIDSKIEQTDSEDALKATITPHNNITDAEADALSKKNISPESEYLEGKFEILSPRVTPTPTHPPLLTPRNTPHATNPHISSGPPSPRPSHSRPQNDHLIDSAPQQEAVLSDPLVEKLVEVVEEKAKLEHDTVAEVSEAKSSDNSEKAVDIDKRGGVDMDPLGAMEGTVQDHVPRSDKGRERLEKRRMQMEALLQ